MWDLRSIAIRTDLFLTAFDGEVIDRDRYLVVRTPSNPDFWWGNFLVYPEPPERGSYAVWLEDHARELAGVRATLLTWDRPDGALGVVDEFLEDGFAIDDGTILTASAVVAPPRLSDDVTVDALASDASWDQATRALIHAYAPRRSGTMDDLRAFVVRQIARYRAMQRAGIGRWYGAFIAGELAGTLGLVRISKSTLGRFQLVATDPRFGRRGVCSTLVYEVSRRALGEEGFETLVMAADADYHAAKVYESVGFRATERLRALMRKPAKA